MLNELTEDLIKTLDGKSIQFSRAQTSPTKSRGKARVAERGLLEIDGKIYTLDDVQIEQLGFITECIKRWLPIDGLCFGVNLPSTVSLQFRFSIWARG